MISPALTEAVQLRMRTEVPGPNSARYLANQVATESNARTYPRRLPVAVAAAYGPYLEDVDGNVFIDFLTGAGALPIGHSHPYVVEAVERQLRTHVHGLDLPTEIRWQFVERHRELLPERMRNRMKIHFCGPTGANAVEAAMKLCKAHTGRSTIVSFQGGFHGSTHGAMAVSGLVAPKEAVPGQLGGVHFFPYPYCLRCPLGLNPRSCETNCATLLRTSLHNDYGGVPRPAAIILELVQGEGGAVPATTSFVRTVAETAKELDIPLVVDEVQTGYGRTGTWWAFEQYDIEPDVILMSKAAGGIGLPVAAMMYDRRLDTWASGTHIGTFRGHQLAFAASVATLEVMRREDVLANVARQSRSALAELERIAVRHPSVLEVRGLGLMLGLEIGDPATGAPDGDRAARIQAEALRRGLIVEVGGHRSAVVRLLPPLNVTHTVVSAALRVLDEAIAEAEVATC
ncbi:diaminobutyrate--2-oxoglutarate transaminase family protein [Paractinoplanes rishiriensis]|uniref:Diaminobutyrate--2-oxoglutarate transaminase n=1 Tax=Paractinoplanes rishiriensis TaxID=1050105 RepID=A0A919K2L2_9ACTN|nr:diaminobutyrate--2-oxoglutarate transaminase family protein [Actinoplanes rishiriensis]GIE99540.1 diaminobutyrate--2-oxoglutarate aminotransferase [Actinoplanes rishiriensis]